jgi:hypothetical protein
VGRCGFVDQPGELRSGISYWQRRHVQDHSSLMQKVRYSGANNHT